MHYEINNESIEVGKPFTNGGKQYPANWVELASEDEITTIGLIFVPDSLDQVKSNKLTQIKQDRDAALTTNVTVHNREWQADAESQRNLSNEILTAQAGVFLTPVWRDATNDNMPVTNIQQLIDIAAAMKLQTLTAYQTSWARKAALDAAVTVEEVEAI